jgi:hypothetical protein
VRLERRAIRSADLFVVLDRAYRRRARRCGKCGFSLPFQECLDRLDELVASVRKTYRLTANKWGQTPI